jgi:enoyl-CoA hydratase/carnithine racemase
MPDYVDLLYEVDGHIAIISLNRPDRLNAISPPMMDSFNRAFRSAHQDTGVRAIILTGAGRGFCAGLDLQAESDGTGLSGEGGSAETRFDLGSSPAIVLHTTDKPIVCAINGPAAGGGIDFAMGCDIRIASTQARLAMVFTKRGVVPETGSTWLLPRLIGWSKAAEVIFRGATLNAQECLELGLVNRVVQPAELMPAAREMAAEIAGNAPLAVQASKRLMRLGLSETFEAHVHHAFLQVWPLIRSQDFREGVGAFMEKRPPQFQGQ